MTETAILGRTAERKQLTEVVERAKALAASVRIVGEAGSGRTTMMEELAAAHPGALVVRLRGIADESGLAWAGLDRLLRSLDAPTQPDPTLRSAVQLLHEALGAGPSGLMLVDDADLLDVETTTVLAAVAARTRTVTVVTTSRPAFSLAWLSAVPPVQLRPLGRDDAVRLLVTHVPTIDAVVAEHLVAQADTNPGTVAGIGEALTQLEPSIANLILKPTPVRLGNQGLSRTDANLGAALAAAAFDAPGRVVDRALTLLGAADASAAPTPAAYWSIAAAARRRVHGCLASAWQESPATPLSTLWRAVHLSWVDPAPADATAQLLVRAAREAAGVADPLQVTGALARAAELTSAPRLRADRTLEAAETARRAGARAMAGALLASIDTGVLDRRGRLRWQVSMNDTGQASSSLLDALAAGAAGGDVRLAQDVLRSVLERSESSYAANATTAARIRDCWYDDTTSAAVLAAAVELGTGTGVHAVPQARTALARLIDAGDDVVRENLALARLVAEPCWDVGLDRLLVQRGGLTPTRHDGDTVARLLAEGSYDAAYEAASSHLESRPPGWRGPWLADCIEAARGAGQLAQARLLCSELAQVAAVVDTPWIHGVTARCRALLCTNEDAVAGLAAALAVLGRTDAPLDVARTHLLLGERLRRQRRRGEAHKHLRTAAETFAAYGHPFEARARREIEVAVPASSPAYSTTLTHQERIVAKLAASGHSNLDISRSLGLSRHTVDHHLRRVYRKLEVTGRDQLLVLLEV